MLDMYGTPYTRALHVVERSGCSITRPRVSEGARVIVWSVSNGLSPALVHAADHFTDFDHYLFPQKIG